jgi:digeranylgeranylglycerophospholipid reductase
VMAVNGGGIPIAIICGRLAGEAAAANVLKGQPLVTYEKTWRDQVEKPLRTAVRTKKLASLCFGSQWRLGAAMSLLGKRRMANMIRCKPVFP